MNELRNEHERQIFEQSNEFNGKLEFYQDKFDTEKRKLSAKHKDEVSMKNEKIQILERQ
jgi:DNA-directed RNA polymerase subunit L